MKDKFMDVLQRLGRTFMMPIALLPIAGLMLGIGASLTGEAFVELYSLEGILGKGTILNSFLSILSDAGEVIFANLPLFFAIAVGMGLAKAAKEVAAFSGAVAYFVMYATMTSTLEHFGNVEELKEVPGLISTVVGFENTMNTGVFGAVIIGLVVVWLHNKYYKIEMPDALSFFAGTRFVPIVSALAGVVLGMVFAFVWPYIGMGIAWLGTAVASLGYVGTFLYGLIYRALIPTGLHHVFYLPFWQTALGGTAEVAGQMVEGAQNIVFAQLAAGEPVSYEAARFFSGQFPFMIFGFPAAAFAMYQTAKEERKADVKGLLFSSSLTSIFTGITEPIEFSILFASSLLYFGVHVVLAAFSHVLMHILQVGVGLTFSGGFIDFFFYGILPGQAMTNWMPVVLVGLVYGVLYYTIFRILIVKLDLKTPGREDATQESKLYTKADYKEQQAQKEKAAEAGYTEQSVDVVAGLGGPDNLVDVGNCATRLRVTVKDGEQVDQGLLKSTGASGVVVKGKNVQVIYGPKVANIKSNVDEYLAAIGKMPNA